MEDPLFQLSESFEILRTPVRAEKYGAHGALARRKRFSGDGPWESYFLPWQEAWADFRHPALLANNMIRPILPLFLFWKYVNLLQISMNQILVSKSHCELECLGAKRYRLWRQNLSSLSRKDRVFYLFLIFSLREVMKKYGIFVNFFLYKGVR